MLIYSRNMQKFFGLYSCMTDQLTILTYQPQNSSFILCTCFQPYFAGNYQSSSNVSFFISVEKFLKNGMSPDLQNQDGLSALHQVCSCLNHNIMNHNICCTVQLCKDNHKEENLVSTRWPKHKAKCNSYRYKMKIHKNRTCWLLAGSSGNLKEFNQINHFTE